MGWTASLRIRNIWLMNTQPPTIISFVSPKGGVGKSTSCLALAAALAHKGHQVQIIDFDQTETLWRWYSTNETARSHPNLTIEKGPDGDLGAFIKSVWSSRSGYVFIDLAGSLTNQMLLMATFAHLTITPTKLNEPDVVEANKLANQLKAIATKIGKPITHRILVNDVPTHLLPAHQAHTLDQIDGSHLHRFDTLMHTRAAYPETFLTGTPPHFADRARANIAKAVDEVDHLLAEVMVAITEQEERVAA